MNTTATAQRTTMGTLRNASSSGNSNVARAPRTILDYLNDDRVRKGLAAVANGVLSPDRVMKLVTNAIHRTPKLALCEPKSVLGSLMASVSLGLEPNTPSGHAYLIPFKRRALINNKWVDVYDCQFQVGYRGFIVLGYRSSSVQSIDADAIYSGDMFNHMKGSKSFLEFSPALVNRGELIGAFCHSHLTEGREVATVMSLDRIRSVRDRSETFRALTARLEEAKAAAAANPRDQKLAKELSKAQSNYDETPWVLREDEMGTKTVIKRHCSARLPLDPGDILRAAVEIDNATERGVIDMSVLSDPDAALSLIHDGEIPSEALSSDADAEDEAGDDQQQETRHDSGAAGATPSPEATKATAAPESTQQAAPRRGRGSGELI